MSRLVSRIGGGRQKPRGKELVANLLTSFTNLLATLTLTRVAVVLLGVPLGYYVYREVTRDVLIIDPISVPKQMEEAGLTPQVMANQVREEMQEMERSTQTSMKKDALGVAAEETAIPEIEIPGTKLGLKTVVDIARNVFGFRSKHLGGDVMFGLNKPGADGGTVTSPVFLTVYLLEEGGGSESLRDTVADSGDLPGLVRRLAELSLRQVNPYVFASHEEGQKHFESATAIVQAMAEDGSEDRLHRTAAFTLWGDVLADQGRYDEASAKYAKAFELDRKNSAVFNNWGIALDAEGKHDEAIAKYGKAAELDSKYAGTYNDWGNALEEEGKHEEAIAKYAKAVEVDPKYAFPYHGWGVALEAEGKNEEAIAKFARAVELDPKYAFAYNSWGSALAGERKNEEAVAKYAQAVQVGPQFALAYRNWAIALRALGKDTEAEEKDAAAERLGAGR